MQSPTIAYSVSPTPTLSLSLAVVVDSVQDTGHCALRLLGQPKGACTRAYVWAQQAQDAQLPEIGQAVLVQLGKQYTSQRNGHTYWRVRLVASVGHWY